MQTVRRPIASVWLVAMALLGVMAVASAPASATFTDMTYNCSVTGPVGSFSCGPTSFPKDSLALTLDGHMGIWETWYAPGHAEVTIEISGTYVGEPNGGYVPYFLGIDKDVVNGTGQTWIGFDITVSGPNGWEPYIMAPPYPTEMNGFWTVHSMNSYGIWFDGQQPDFDSKAMFWLGLMVPLHVDGQNVYGSFVLNQDAKVPEPATLAMFGLGLAGLGYMRRRRAN